MYHEYYNLSMEPFRLSPDYRFCYKHRSYGRAKTYMSYALDRGEGFVVVTGQPGTGKSTLIEDLFADLRGKPLVRAKLVSTQVEADELLRMVAYAFGVEAADLDKATLLARLTDVLIRNRRTQRGALLVVDEAQDLAPSALEELRLLTNLQEHSTPLLQIFLVGQQGLRDVIRQQNMEQLHQRIIAACHLEALATEETQAYVEHRLVCAGWEGDPCISDAAYYIIHQFTDGVPRRINLVCSRLLLYGSAEEKHKLQARDVRVVLQELCDEHLDPADGLGFSKEIRDLVINTHLGIDDDCTPTKTQTTVVIGNEQPSPEAQPSHAALEDSELPEDEAIIEPMRAARSATRQHIERDLDNGAPAATVAPVVESASPPADSEALVSGGNTQKMELRRLRRRKRRRGIMFSLLAAALSTLVIYAVAPEPTAKVGASLAAGLKASAGRLAALLPAADEQTHEGGRTPVRGDDVAATESTVNKPSSKPRPEPGVAASRRDSGEETVRKGIAQDPETNIETKVDEFARPLMLADKPEYRTQSLDPNKETSSTQRASAAATMRPEQSTKISPSEHESGGDSTELPTAGSGEGPSVRGHERPLNPVAAGKKKSTGSSRNGFDDRELEPLPGTAKSQVAIKSIEALEKKLRTFPIQVKRVSDDAIQVDLGREVLFAFDSAVISTSSRVLLDRLARSLRRYADIGLRVIGHADGVGSEEYNLRLSRRRAEAVANYLKQRDVQGLWIQVEGRGSSEPVVPSAGGSRRLNRRIELYIQAATQG